MVSRLNNTLHLPKIDKKLVVFLFILLICASFFRFYHLTNLMYWMFDEERDAFIVKNILIDRHLTLIGGSIPGGFYLGPGYFYISSIFYFFSKGNPVGLAITASSLGVISVLLLFFICKQIFNKTIAVAASLIYCCSYLAASYNRTWWPLTFGPTLSLICYISLFKIIKEKKYFWSIPLSISLIVGAQSDPSNFSLIVLTVFCWMFYRLSVKNKYVLFSILFFSFSHVPLLIFDLRHNFLNTKQLIKLIIGPRAESGVNLMQAFNNISLLPQIFSRFIYVNPNPDFALQIIPNNYYIKEKINSIPILLIIFSYFVLIWFFAKYLLSLKSKNNFGIKIISAHILISVTGIFAYNIFYPGYIQEWFFQLLFPAFSIILGLLLFETTKFFKSSIIIFSFLIVYLFTSFFVMINATNSYNFRNKNQAVIWSIEKTGNKPFALSAIGQNFSYGGYRYLYYINKKEPVKSYVDYIFNGWLYNQNSEKYPSLIVVIANPDFYFNEKYNQDLKLYLAHTVEKKNFGRILVLIVDNSKKWLQ